MNAIIRPSKSIWLTFDQIDFPAKARPTNATDVVALVSSIRAIGLQVPLTVIDRDGRYLLIAGRHRLEALRVIGEERVPVRVVDFDDIEARLWSISENLHRTELTALQRSEQIAEFARLTKERQNAAKDAQGAQVFYGEKPVQVAQVSGGRGNTGGDNKREAEVSRQVGAKPDGRPEGGNRAAARELELTEQEVRRAQTIAALPAETKEAARSLDYEDNQSALLAAAKEQTPEAQIAALQTIAERGRVTLTPSARPLRDLIGISGGELARWIKITSPNDRPHVIRVLRMAADILEDAQ